MNMVENYLQKAILKFVITKLYEFILSYILMKSIRSYNRKGNQQEVG